MTNTHLSEKTILLDAATARKVLKAMGSAGKVHALDNKKHTGKDTLMYKIQCYHPSLKRTVDNLAPGGKWETKYA